MGRCVRKRKAERPGNPIEGLDSFTLFRRPYVPTVTGRARELEFERDCSDVQRLDLAELIRGVVSVVRRVLVVGEVETDVVLARGRLDEGVLAPWSRGLGSRAHLSSLPGVASEGVAACRAREAAT